MTQVTVYTKPGCRTCKRIMDQLTGLGVDYTAVDISEDDEAYRFVSERLGAKSVPVVYAEGFEPVKGYRPEKVRELVAALALTPNAERNA